jgi:formylglycine-generating enzyme required for sulfatase activity
VALLVGCPKSETDSGRAASYTVPVTDTGELPEHILGPKDDTMKLILIPEGEAIFGADDSREEHEQPQFTASLPPYYLGETEVTNAQFVRFLNDVQGDIRDTCETYEDERTLQGRVLTYDPETGPISRWLVPVSFPNTHAMVLSMPFVHGRTVPGSRLGRLGRENR